MRVTPSEKTKLYLTKKLNEIEQKIKKTKKKEKTYTNNWGCGNSGEYDLKCPHSESGFSTNCSDVIVNHLSYIEWNFNEI